MRRPHWRRIAHVKLVWFRTCRINPLSGSGPNAGEGGENVGSGVACGGPRGGRPTRARNFLSDFTSIAHVPRFRESARGLAWGHGGHGVRLWLGAGVERKVEGAVLVEPTTVFEHGPGVGRGPPGVLAGSGSRAR